MSNSTRPSYDERFVVPLEASRRGAHRARVSPLMAALPVVAVSVLVAAVVGLAFTLFSDDSTNPGTQAGAEPTAQVSVTPTGTPVQSGEPSESPEPTESPEPSAEPTVDKSIELTVYNGTSPAVQGQGARAKSALVADGWKIGTPETWTKAPLARTTVFYATEELAATAKAIVKDLGTGVARLSAAQAGEDITVVIGNDWQP